MRFRWQDEALDEYQRAAHFYGFREIGLDERFIECIESAIDSVCDSPKRWPFLEDDFRRKVVDVFPYSVIYLEDNAGVVIVAIMHDSREPGYWRKRLD